MTTETVKLLVEQPVFPDHVPWDNVSAVQQLEEKLRQNNHIGTVDKEGKLAIVPFRDFVPDHVFTAKWNSAAMVLPTGDVYEDPLPTDWSLTPNPKDRLSLTEIELHHNVKYAVEGETGIIATVTDEGLEITHVGAYQDISDRDVSPAGKTWGNGKIAGMGPLWIEVASWEELDGSMMNANIIGEKADNVEGDVPHVVSIPADVNKLARHWKEDLVKVLVQHPVYQDAELKPGERILFTTGLLYWEEDYSVRYYKTNVTPTIHATATLTLQDGRQVESRMTAHTITPEPTVANESQKTAIRLWEKHTNASNDIPTRTHQVDPLTQNAYHAARDNQMQPNKLGRLVSSTAFTVEGNPDASDALALLPTLGELKQRYTTLVNNWPEGAGIELNIARSGFGTEESKGRLPGVLVGKDGNPIDDTILKRSAQRAYDVGSALWNKEQPDLLISSGRTSSLATLEIAMYGIGKPYPAHEIKRDWRLNERSFGKATGDDSAKYPTDVLYSFEQAVPCGENYSQVHHRALAFMVDLMETAADFYKEEQRPMRVLISPHEAPMQIMLATLAGVTDQEGVFQGIGNTQLNQITLSEPFSWPKYIDDESVEKNISRETCSRILDDEKRIITKDTVVQAAVLLIAYRTRYDFVDQPDKLREIDMTIEDLEAGCLEPHALLIMADDLMQEVGKERVAEIATQMVEILKDDPILNITTSDGSNVRDVLTEIVDLTTQYRQ